MLFIKAEVINVGTTKMVLLMDHVFSWDEQEQSSQNGIHMIACGSQRKVLSLLCAQT